MLGVSWNIANSGLASTSERLSIVSKNISRAGDANASRKLAEQVATIGGGVHLGTVARAENVALFEASLSARASANMYQVVGDALDRIRETIDPGLAQSPSSRLSRLEASLRQYAVNPADQAAGRDVVSAASSLVDTLRAVSATVDGVRSDAEREIGRTVDRLNMLLGDLETLGREIRRDSGSGADITDKRDERDKVLQNISDIIGIRVVSRGQDDVVVYSDSGHVLFETTARVVGFTPNAPLVPGVPGGEIFIDGVPAESSGSGIRSGSLRGLLQVRDEIAGTVQAQIDEFARGLVEAFSDPDRSGAGGSNLPGLFTWPGGTVPASGTLVNGLARLVQVNPAIDPAQGGSLAYLRDGGASAPGNPAYIANPTGAAGYSARVEELIDALVKARSFAPEAAVSGSIGLGEMASESVGWIEAARQTNAAQLEVRLAVLNRSAEALSGARGVNLDQEMTDMLMLERSFQASSRLLSTVDQLLQSLLSELR